MSRAPARLKVGISEAVNTVLAIWMARAAGLYAAADLDVEIVNMNGGSRGATELAAGRLDAMHVGLSSVVGLNQSGADLRVIAALANVIRFTFFCSREIKTASDLKGRAVGISSFGSETDTTVTFILARLGLSRSDVILKECGGGGRRIAALQTGEIAATPVNEPVSSMARGQGIPVLLDLVPQRIPWLFTAIVVRREAIASGRDVLTRFIAATAKGNQLALADEARAKAVLAEKADIGDDEVLEISYRDFQALSPPALRPTQAGADNILAQFPSASRDLARYIDTSILDAALAAGRP